MLRFCTVAYKNFEIVKRLCDSIEQHCQVEFEVFCWDNSEEALKNLDVLSQTHSKIKIFRSGQNIGFTAAANKIMSHTSQTGEISTDLILINPDAYIVSDIKDDVIQSLRSLKALSGLAVFNDEGKTIRQQSARSFPNFLTAFTGREGLLTRLWKNNPYSKRYLRTDLSENTAQKVDWVSGCALYVSRDIWNRLGGFDERYFLYADDVDLGRKAQSLGIPVFYAPFIQVIHESRTVAGKNPWRSDFHHHVGMSKYYWKWSGPVGRIFMPLIFVGIWSRFLLRRLLGPLGRTST